MVHHPNRSAAAAALANFLYLDINGHFRTFNARAKVKYKSSSKAAAAIHCQFSSSKLPLDRNQLLSVQSKTGKHCIAQLFPAATV